MVKKKLKLLFIFLILLVVAGCGKEKDTTEEEIEYRETSVFFSIPEKENYFELLGVTDDFFYYSVVQTKETEGNLADERLFYQGTLEESPKTKLIAALVDPIYRGCFLETDSNGNDKIYLLLGEEKEGKRGYYIVDIEQATKCFLADELFSYDAPNRFIKLEDGQFLVLTSEYCVLVEADGATGASVKCPTDSYRGLVAVDKDTVGITYFDGNEQTTYMSILDLTTNRLNEGIKIAGDGTLLASSAGEIVFFDADAIWSYEPYSNQAEVLLGLKGRNIVSRDVSAIKVVDEGIRVFGLNSDGTSAKYTLYTRNDGENLPESSVDSNKNNAYGKQVIYLYDYADQLPQDMTNPIDAFNERNDSFQVVVKDYQYKDEYDAAQMIASGDYPDIIYSTYNTFIAGLVDKDCLEDLSVYIDRSSNLSMEDLSGNVVEAYTDQVTGKLFALPDHYTIETLYGTKAELEEGGWTTEEFLDWLAEHPNAQALHFPTKRDIFDVCIDGMLEQSNGKINLNEEELKLFAEKLKNLEMVDTSEYSLNEMMELYENDASRLGDHIENLGQIAIAENEYKEEFVVKGYPGADGMPHAYINSPAMSILSTSEVKQGAYEFLEFYLMYVEKTQGEAMREHGTFRLTIDRDSMEKAKQRLLQTTDFLGTPCTFTERQVDEVIDIIPYVRRKDYSLDTLRNLIWEELEYYLEGKKDLEETCRIIQSRVHVYLGEREIAE